MAGTQRAHILIPSDLLSEIDNLVGPRGRTAFLLETARQEVQRRKLLHFLESEKPAWKAKDHPELEDGTAVWVRSLRRQSERHPITSRESSRKSFSVKPPQPRRSK
jgi:hypothetical protein